MMLCACAHTVLQLDLPLMVHRVQVPSSSDSLDQYLAQASPGPGGIEGGLDRASSAPREREEVPPGDAGEQGPLQWQQHSAYR